MDKTQQNQPSSSWKGKIALFMFSQNVSLFGSSVVSFAIIWHITLETSSGIWLTLATICSLLPQVIISLWAGVWADRYNRKYLIMLADGFIALATFGLAVMFWLGVQNLEMLLAVSVIRSLGSGIQTPAVNALYPQIVPEDKLVKIQGLNQTINSVLLLLAPAAGGLIFGTLGISGTFMTDVVTAILAIIIVSFMHIKKIPKTDEPLPVLTELMQGIRYAWGNKLLKILLICSSIAFILITPGAILTPLLVERTFGNEVWYLTANEIAWTAGAIAGGIFVTMKSTFKNKIRGISIGLACFGVAFILLGIPRHFWMYLIIMGISGMFMPVVGTLQTVLIQENVEPKMMGRVFSFMQIVTAGAVPISILFFGPLADVISVESILAVSGMLLALAALFFSLTAKRAGIYK